VEIRRSKEERRGGGKDSEGQISTFSFALN
jgi:hypothetical protein